MEDEYLDKMAKLCGWKATLVYTSICRHIDKKTQSCFPSITTMATRHKVSRTSILKGIAILKERGVIEVQKKKTPSGRWLNNTYTLIDRSEWDYCDEVYLEDLIIGPFGILTESTSDTNPCPSSVPSLVYPVVTKETHGKETHHKETHSFLQNGDVSLNGNIFGKDFKVLPSKKKEKKRAEMVDIFTAVSAESVSESIPKKEIDGAELNDAIRLFEPILPGDFVEGKSALEKTPTRKAVAAFLSSHTVAELAELIRRYYEGRHNFYRPQVGTVYQFCTSHLAKIEHFTRTADDCFGSWEPDDLLTIEKVREQERKDEEDAREGMEYARKMGYIN